MCTGSVEDVKEVLEALSSVALTSVQSWQPSAALSVNFV